MSLADDGTPLRRRPPGRYDEPGRTAQRVWAVGLGLLFVGLLAAITLNLYARFGSPDVRVQVRAFEVLDEDAVLVDFTASPPEGERAWCLVRARSLDGTEVGREFVAVDAADDGDGVRVRHVLPTTDRAVSGEVLRCLTAEPPTDARTTAPREPADP